MKPVIQLIFLIAFSLFSTLTFAATPTEWALILSTEAQSYTCDPNSTDGDKTTALQNALAGDSDLAEFVSGGNLLGAVKCNVSIIVGKVYSPMQKNKAISDAAAITPQVDSSQLSTTTCDTDAARTAALQQKYATDQILSYFHLTSSVVCNNATVSGQVASQQQKDRAYTIAKSVQGVIGVDVTGVSLPSK